MYRQNEHLNLPNLHSRDISHTQMTYSVSSNEDSNEYRANLGMITQQMSKKKPKNKTSQIKIFLNIEKPSTHLVR